MFLKSGVKVLGQNATLLSIARRARMARKRTQTSVTVNQVSKVELTKRGSRNSLEIEVRRGTELLGTLFPGLGQRSMVATWKQGQQIPEELGRFRGAAR
jgi:hypothetical protein